MLIVVLDLLVASQLLFVEIARLGRDAVCRFNDEFQQACKGWKDEDSDGATQLIPVFCAGGEIATALLVEPIRQLKDLMHEESKEVEKK